MRYQDMDRPTLDAAYNNTAAVGQARRDEYIAGWAARSDALRRARGGRLDRQLPQPMLLDDPFPHVGPAR